MKFSKSLLLVCMSGIISLSVPVFGHHPIASQYSVNTTQIVRGVVSKVEFGSPHTYVFIQVLNDEEGAVQWQIEWSSFPSLLNFWGIDKTTLKPGMALTVTGYASKNNDSHMMVPMSVRSPSGLSWDRVD